MAFNPLTHLVAMQSNVLQRHISSGDMPAALRQHRYIGNALKYHAAPFCAKDYFDLLGVYCDNPKAALEMEIALDELIVATEKNFERALKTVLKFAEQRIVDTSMEPLHTHQKARLFMRHISNHNDNFEMRELIIKFANCIEAEVHSYYAQICELATKLQPEDLEMGYIVRSKNTGVYLVVRRKEAQWTGTKTCEFDAWTTDINEASDLAALLHHQPDANLRKILSNPDSERLEAEFKTTTIVTLVGNK